MKYCYYISQVWGVEVLQLKAEYLKDENGCIWLFYMRDIYTRKNKNKTQMNSVNAKKQAEKIQQNKDKMRDQMIKELEGYEQ